MKLINCLNSLLGMKVENQIPFNNFLPVLLE